MRAEEFYNQNPAEAVRYLTDYSVRTATKMVERWVELGKFLIVKYNDMVVKPEENGVFKRTPEGLGAPVKSPGYPESTRERIIKETGDRFKVIGQN